MKHSKFNYTYETEKGVVLYNTFSKALIELSLEEFQHFTNGDFGEYKGTFYDNGYIVEDGFDELEYLKYIHYRTRFSSDVMTLTIAPTLDCNFDCPYCFEDKRKGYMSVSVQRAVVEFIKRQITSGIKTIDLTWYGGEPLLYIDIIKCIYDGIIDPIKDNNVELKQFLITNGFLLTPNTISVLEHCGIRHIQITLDGKESDHDKRRYLRDGSGTFSTIMNNIMNLRGKDFILDIRSNIDSENAKGYEDLERELKAIKDINVRLYPAVTEKINERNLFFYVIHGHLLCLFLLQFSLHHYKKHIGVKGCPHGKDVHDLPAVLALAVQQPLYLFCLRRGLAFLLKSCQRTQRQQLVLVLRRPAHRGSQKGERRNRTQNNSCN